MTHFIHQVFIPFHLVDAAGILFFSHAFTLAHQAFENFVIEGLHLKWETWFQNSNWGVPIKQAEADYCKPLLAGQPCLIKLCVEEIRSSSFVMGYQFDQEENTCCKLKIAHVFCDQKTRQKIPIPIEILPFLKKYCFQLTAENLLPHK